MEELLLLLLLLLAAPPTNKMANINVGEAASETSKQHDNEIFSTQGAG